MVIKNVSFINSETKTILTCDIVIKDGRIASFATPNTAVDEDGEYIDATGLYAAPGSWIFILTSEIPDLPKKKISLRVPLLRKEAAIRTSF